MRRGDFAVVVAALAALVMVSDGSQARRRRRCPPRLGWTTAWLIAHSGRNLDRYRSLVERLLIQTRSRALRQGDRRRSQLRARRAGRANLVVNRDGVLDHRRSAVALADKASDGDGCRFSPPTRARRQVREAARVSRTSSSPPTRRTSARTSRSVRSCSASRTPRRHRTLQEGESRSITRRPTTRWATRTPGRRLRQRGRRRSEYIQLIRAIRTQIPTANCC